MSINFRVWDKEDHRMIPPKYLYSIDLLQEQVTERTKCNYTFSLRSIPFDKVEIMQSTGFFDKNGQEIFEGDVVKCSGLLGIIKSFKAMWICSFVKYSNYQKVGFFAKEIEVVGNIHENWELVKEEKDRSCE